MTGTYRIIDEDRDARWLNTVKAIPWTRDEIVTVRMAWRDGKTSAEIVKLLKGRSRSSIMGLIWRKRMKRA